MPTKAEIIPERMEYEMEREKKAEKKILAKRIQELDSIVEARLLSMSEWEERTSLDKDNDRLYIMEETHWRQRAGKLWVLKGDSKHPIFSSVCQWEEEEEHYCLSGL